VCVCVYRLNRRKPSGTICTLRLYIILYYIILYYIILQFMAGDHRGPGGSVINEDTPRDLRKRTCGTLVTHLGAFKSQLVVTIVPYNNIYITN